MKKQLGITPPISYTEPTKKDTERTEDLVQTLHGSGFFESEQESINREVALGELNLIIQTFTRGMAQKKALPEELVRKTEARMYTFGSYRLGVHSKGADIDTLFVAPQHVSRQEFFTDFVDALKNTPDVKELVTVSDAYVPVLKMNFRGIQIDLVFARIPLPTLRDEFSLSDPSILKTLEDKCAISLNGFRCVDEILGLVPDIATFHTVLRCIKLWAKRRLLYGNVLGYFAGISLALLSARICQLYPKAAPATIVTRFFKIYHKWSWPQPVYLKHMEDLGLNKKIWNPKLYAADRLHRMPIITPAYPSMCSTHNISQSTFRCIMDEFRRGIDVTDAIEEGKMSWNDLLQHAVFFENHKNFCQVICVCDNETDHRVWWGYVESKLRQLVLKLEAMDEIVYSPPHPAPFHFTIESTSEESALSIHTNTPIKDREVGEKKTYHTTCFYVAIRAAKVPPEKPKRLFLDGVVREFKYMLSVWDKIKDNMRVVIRGIKKQQLPAYALESDRQ
ncbi:MAG: poly(A) polymerase [Amphiamblys sp. WSBS2006]|nr:MAG: poly(A) polymerase [Amphiamblys sp. WSBS2006]